MAFIINLFNTYYPQLKIANETVSLGAGLVGAYRGNKQRRVAEEIRDLETEQNAHKKLITKAAIVVGSSLYVIGKTFEILGAGIGFTFSAVARNIFGAFAVITMGRAGYEAYRCSQFRKELVQKLEPKNEERTEEDRAKRFREALVFLKKEFIEVSDDLKQEIEQYVEKRSAEQMQAIQEKVKQAVKKDKDEATRKANAKKVNWCARRIGLKATDALLEIDSIIKKLESPQTRCVGIGRAAKLTDLIQQENAKKIALHATVVLAAFVAFAGFLVGAATGVGLASYAISGVSAFIYLGAESYIVSYDWSNKKHKKIFEVITGYRVDRDA